MNPAIINITSVEHVGGYCLRLQFDDATEQIVDFGPFLSHASILTPGLFSIRKNSSPTASKTEI